MSTTEFVTAPALSNRQKLEAFAADLRANPGKWAVYPTVQRNPNQTVWRIKHGKVKELRNGFQAIKDNDDRVLVRYAPKVVNR